MILIVDEQTDSIRHVFPFEVPSELLRTVFPTRGLQVDVGTHFIEENIDVVECVPMSLDTLALEILSIFWSVLHFYFGRGADTASAASSRTLR